MHISDQQISFMLKKTAVLREQLQTMCVAKQGPVLSVMDLRYVVEQVYELKIDMLEVNSAAVYLRGKVERYSNGTARVLVRSGVSDAEKRLVTVKELCHLALDEKDDWSNDGGAMLDAIVAESRAMMTGTVSEKTKTPLHSEALALSAAFELLYPVDYRETDMEKLMANETTISAIAMQHEVPPFVIGQALQDEGRFGPLRVEAGAVLGIAAE